jgi:hypothetical protein
MPSITRSTARSTSTAAERPTPWLNPTRTASRNTDGAADAGRPRAPEAAKAAGRESGSGRSDGGSGVGRVPAGTNGLVICAKNVRAPAADSGGGAEWRACDALGLRFPSPELVTSAASLFEQTPPWAAGSARRGPEPESGRFRVTVGPGVVRLAWTNPVRKEKAAQRAVKRHKGDVDDWQTRVKDLVAAACLLDAQAVIAVAQCKWDQIAPGRSGRRVTQWSRKSRTAMCRTFAELDYTPLVDDGRVPAMITLTYPGDWELVAPDGASVKRHMVLWRKRFHREYGESARYIWKLEFQRRGAPHVHLWMAPPTRRGRSGQAFRDWLSHAWTNVVAHPDPSERARHLLAGTAVDVLNGLRACDPKRLAIYFTKHSSPNTLGDKEYQHIVPEPWREPGKGPGRFWGVFGLKRATATVEIDKDAYLTARRIIRRWSRSQAAYGDDLSRYPNTVTPRTAYHRVQRVDHATGRLRYRVVRRRRAICDQGGLAGGFALVNDGPAFAAQLARATTG